MVTDDRPVSEYFLIRESVGSSTSPVAVPSTLRAAAAARAGG